MTTIDVNSKEFKEAVAAAVEEATAGLVAKRDELLKEVKSLRKGQQVDPETVSKLEEQVDALKADLSKAQKDLKTANTATEKLQKQLETESGFTQKLLIDNGLTAELTKNGVTNPVHLKAAQALLRSGVQIVVDGENRVAKVGDKPLADHVKAWAAGDEGKHFVAAPTNSGGGAAGGSGGRAATKTVTRAQFSAMSPADQMAHAKEGGTVTD